MKCLKSYIFLLLLYCYMFFVWYNCLDSYFDPFFFAMLLCSHFIYSKQEIENMSEDLRKRRIQMYFDNYDDLQPEEAAGLGAADSTYAWSDSYSLFGSRLALKSEDLAVYVGRMFPELYYDWLWS